jgi:transposase InsO family protein
MNSSIGRSLWEMLIWMKIQAPSRLLDGALIDDHKVFNNKLQEWEDYYNYHRPHGRLGDQTPYERLRQKAQTRV